MLIYYKVIMLMYYKIIMLLIEKRAVMDENMEYKLECMKEKFQGFALYSL